MTALFWLGVSLVGALVYATGAVAYWHAHPDRKVTGRKVLELAVAWLLPFGGMLGWGQATTNDGVMVEVATVTLIAGSIVGAFFVATFMDILDLPTVDFTRALLWPFSLLASVVTAATWVLGVNVGRLGVVASRGPASLGRAVADASPARRAELRESKKAQREQHIAELEAENERLKAEVGA